MEPSADHWKVLVDHCVRQDAITAREIPELVERNALGRVVQVLEITKQTRPKRMDWRQDEIDCLPRVAELAQRGVLGLFETDELYGEYFRAAKFSLGEDDIFHACKFEFLPPPLPRSLWGLSLEEYMNKEHLINFCETALLSPSEKDVERFIEKMQGRSHRKLSNFEIKCLNRLGVFKDICSGIDKKHYPDALHFWTAEENGMDFFLTHDQKFINVIAGRRLAINCRAVRSTELLKALGASIVQ